jgi:hypothetical protein
MAGMGKRNACPALYRLTAIVKRELQNGVMLRRACRTVHPERPR